MDGHLPVGRQGNVTTPRVDVTSLPGLTGTGSNAPTAPSDAYDGAVGTSSAPLPTVAARPAPAPRPGVIPEDVRAELKALLASGPIAASDIARFAVTHANAEVWPNLPALLANPAKLDAALPSAITDNHALRDAMTAGLKAGVDSYFEPKLVEVLARTLASTGIASGVVRSDEGLPPVKDGIYSEVDEAGRSRQVTVFAPEHLLTDAWMARVIGFAKLQSFQGMRAAHGGTNVINFTPPGADKGRLAQYLVCRGDLSESTPAICAAKNLGPGGNDLPLTKKGLIDARPINTPSEFGAMLAASSAPVVIATSSVIFDAEGPRKGRLAEELLAPVLALLVSGRTFAVATGRKLQDLLPIVDDLEAQAGRPLSPTERERLVFAYNNCAGIISAAQL